MSRSLQIELRINTQYTLGERFQFVRTTFRDDFPPQGHCPLGYPQRFGEGDLGTEMGNRDRFEHTRKV